MVSTDLSNLAPSAVQPISFQMTERATCTMHDVADFRQKVWLFQQQLRSAARPAPPTCILSWTHTRGEVFKILLQIHSNLQNSLKAPYHKKFKTTCNDSNPK